MTAAMGDAVIRKGPADLRVTPNFGEYDATRASFDWADVPDLCAGMGPGLCNIGLRGGGSARRRTVATKTALRQPVADAGAGSAAESGPAVTSALTTHDVSYAELGRLTRKFTNVLRGLGIGKGDKVFVIMGRVLSSTSAWGALRNGSVVSPLFSAFGPEPIATRVNIGHADVLVTTASSTNARSPRSATSCRRSSMSWWSTARTPSASRAQRASMARRASTP